MNGFIAKVARLAVSKAAAFGYAVAVGVAGNIAFHYVEPAAPPPATAASVAARPAPEDAAPAPAPAERKPAPAVAARPERKPVPPPRPAEPHRAVASAPVLPEPTAVALPRTDALLSPVFKPAALPREAATPPVAPPAPPPAAAPAEKSAAATPAAPPVPPPVALPPLGPAIEVDAPPTPPTADAPPLPAAPVAAAVPAPPKKPRPTQPPAAVAPQDGLEISDLWHPGRAVRRGLHWAGRQVPLVGDGDGEPARRPAAVAAPHAAVAAPIPLLPAAGEAGSPPRKPSAPGPGSGGLY